MLNKPVLSLCMIVKNEKENLPRSLGSAKPYVGEIIVVDTGSEDGTPEIAAEFGAKVSYFEWCDDFAAARNYAISQASGDWILMLDADEELVVDADNYLDQLIAQPEIIAYSLVYTEVNDYSPVTPSFRLSLFRNIPEHRYVGRFHEYLKYHNQELGTNHNSHLKSLKIIHYGFKKEQLTQKNINRNIPILEKIRQKEGLNLMLLYCLAGMYADTQQAEKTQECYAEAFDKLLSNLIEGNIPDQMSFVPSLMFVLGTQFLQQADYETVRLICQRGLEWYPTFPPLIYLSGATVKALGFPLGAVAYFENCLRLGQEGNYYKGEPFEPNYMTIFPAYDLGCIYIDLERPQEALKSFELVLSFDDNFTAAQEKVKLIKQYLASQA